MKRPRLKRTSRVYMAPDQRSVVLVSPDARHVYSEPLVRDLLPLLDGNHTIQAIATALGRRHSLVNILGSLHRLQKAGHVVDDVTLPAGGPIYWEAQGCPAPSDAVIGVRAFGNVSSRTLIDAIRALGIAIGQDGAALEIVITDDYLRPEIGVHVQDIERPCLLVCPTGPRLWLGPLLVPGQTACWTCMTHRMRQNLAIDRFITRETGMSPEPVTLPAMTALAAQAAALQAAHFVAGGQRRLANTLLVWDPVTLAHEYHPVTRLPQCPACGDPAPREPRPIILRGNTVQSRNRDYRASTLDETLARYQHHISPLTGIVSALEPVAVGEGIHVYRARSLRPSAEDAWEHLSHSERYWAGGKGSTALQAKVGALCEALERYSSLRLGDEMTVVSRYAELGEAAIHPSELIHFSAAQYASREEYNRRARVNAVPLPFDDTTPGEWTRVWSVTGERWRYVPAAMCYFAVDQRHRSPFWKGDSNGNAAGCSLEDAILQGFFEVVERDCAAMWWYNRVPRPAVSLEGIDDALIASLNRFYPEMGRRFCLLDITNDLAIPAFVALSYLEDGSTSGISYGFGCHLDPRIAAIRALTEMNQLLPGVLRHSEREDRRFQSGAESGTLGGLSPADEACLRPAPELPMRHVGFYPGPASDDVVSALDVCLKRVADLGMEVLVHDLTRPDVGLPVVKVIVPGMRHFWRRLAPGRLYDVPVKLGWLDAPLREDQMNPFDITL